MLLGTAGNYRVCNIVYRNDQPLVVDNGELFPFLEYFYTRIASHNTLVFKGSNCDIPILE
jgi:hypothetical protein